ncbi:MAG TPA: DUF1178 family protein [Acetobacteraceae bacterium]|nr:DUF1178 family protein [Acetobacteraceae bacterium]
MIHYRVRCSEGHEFEGWFKDSQAFDRQAKRGLIGCPVCGGVDVARALMAPALPRAHAPAPPPAPAPAAKPMAVAGKAMPDQLKALLQKMRSEVERNCEYVGPGFADEARRIHRGESERRGIYGEASPEQAESLSDEGIEVARIPWVDRADG